MIKVQAVIVNIAVTTSLARDLGVEGHICELQLMLDICPFMLVYSPIFFPLTGCDLRGRT